MMALFDDFLLRSLLAGVGLCLATGPLGAFVVWRRMAYFGDATSHAAILGVAISLGFGVSVYAGTLGVALLMALTVAHLSGRGYAADTVLGVLAHAALAIGLVAASFIGGLRVDLSAWLFGDILAVSRMDLAIIWLGGLVVLALLVWRWQNLLTATVSEALAKSAGIDGRREQLVLTVALALTVAVAIKIVGALLIAALLIVPAAAARQVARSPEAMAVSATLIGMASVAAGIFGSLRWDTPAGPSIVVGSALIFVMLLLFRRRH
ncbi:metal ABC transporter permease [Thioclava sp. FTW29]|uniref:High-affinity zinc uptake system membrane protein ZnuB n=1 Tax=Thioclava litoralis TaxID=3076557 RepID=A0ABZ1E742_9RHOB|nr:metal ABC transporter permease [Thioclava sp. FTW29]